MFRVNVRVPANSIVRLDGAQVLHRGFRMSGRVELTSVPGLLAIF